MSVAPPAKPDLLVARLAQYLGPNTARVAVRVFTEQVTGRTDAVLRPEEIPRLLGALRPMLRTLLGKARAEELLVDLGKDLQ